VYSIFELLATCFYIPSELLNRFAVVKASSAHFTALAQRQKFLQVYEPFFRTGENDGIILKNEENQLKLTEKLGLTENSLNFYP